MPRPSVRLICSAAIVVAMTALLSPSVSGAQAITGSLIDITAIDRPEFYDDLERAAARANQSVYNVLLPTCGLSEATCSTAQHSIFEETRELIETANDILNNGQSNANSLQVDDEGLGNALRWTAAEEVSAKSRAASDFSNGQTTSVNHRVTALRFGARGFSIAGLPGLPARDALGIDEELSLESAGVSETLSKLGGFANGAYGFGDHDPTTFEDAFDYESIDLTFGVDYRFRPQLAFGVVAGYAENEVDFDASKSIVDGGITAEGFSIGAFGLYTREDFYLSGFLSFQRMFFDIDRFITYPSLNPNITGTDTRTEGDTDSNAVTVSGNVGYTYRFGPGKSKPFVLEPSIRAEYTNITIKAYNELNVDAGEVFALRIAEQDFESMEVSLGLRGSVALSTPIGVFFPYARGEWRFELIDDRRDTTSRYLALEDLASSAVPFLLQSERIEKSYGTIVVG
ncbi:MAG: autotransporter outer membrane beta-barrel domain-containing protein, partial [Myxococcota bacterium]